MCGFFGIQKESHKVRGPPILIHTYSRFLGLSVTYWRKDCAMGARPDCAILAKQEACISPKTFGRNVSQNKPQKLICFLLGTLKPKTPKHAPSWTQFDPRTHTPQILVLALSPKPLGEQWSSPFLLAQFASKVTHEPIKARLKVLFTRKTRQTIF